jgi:hypothetical protein
MGNYEERRKREEGRRKKDEGTTKDEESIIFFIPNLNPF